MISQSGTKRNAISPVPDKGGTDRTDITGTKRTEMDCLASLKWHRSNRNAWHNDTEMGGTKRTEVSTIILLLYILVLSCSKDYDNEEILIFSKTEFPQTWELSSINVGLSGETITDVELRNREIYTFQEKGKITKEFKDEYAQGIINGTYELLSMENDEFLKITYGTAMDSLSYCSSDNVEYLLIADDGVILYNGGCLAFDGPAMSYIRTE